MSDSLENPSPKRPIIIKRKKAGGDGHHGGAWKVAYADFVTAMMALFIVLWLMSADKEVQEAVSAYFNNPSGPGKLIGTAAAGVGNAIEMPKEDMNKLAEKIQQALLTVPNFRQLKDHVEITVTSDGLRIELLETEAGVFFDSGKPVPNTAGAELLTRLAEELGKLPNTVLIEGHTDSKPFSGDGSYTNWELSADRANAARKIMQAHGIRPEQVGQVRGYADRQLRRPEDPESPSNRRISVIVQYLPHPAGPGGASVKTPPGEGAEHGVAGEAKPPAHGVLAPAPAGEHGAAPAPPGASPPPPESKPSLRAAPAPPGASPPPPESKPSLRAAPAPPGASPPPPEPKPSLRGAPAPPGASPPPPESKPSLRAAPAPPGASPPPPESKPSLRAAPAPPGASPPPPESKPSLRAAPAPPGASPPPPESKPSLRAAPAPPGASPPPPESKPSPPPAAKDAAPAKPGGH